jgi:hypothetical protein
MQLKRLRAEQDNINWPAENQDLPTISWKSRTPFPHGHRQSRKS